MPETASRNAFLRLTDCGKARFVLPESLFLVVIKPLQHCRKGFSVMRESLFHGVGKALPHNGKARFARWYSHYGTQKRLSDVSEEPFSVFQSTEACRWKLLRRLTTRFPSHCLFSFENFRCKDFLLPETHIYSLSYILMPYPEAACVITSVPFAHALTPPPPCRLRCQRSARGKYVRSSMTLL